MALPLALANTKRLIPNFSDIVSQPLPIVHVDQLQPGVFVSLELGWLDHPFLVNSFLIKDADQLAALRELGLSHFSYDPQRSTNKPLPLLGDHQRRPGQCVIVNGLPDHLVDLVEACRRHSGFFWRRPGQSLSPNSRSQGQVDQPDSGRFEHAKGDTWAAD